ncbi:hypothetical protein GW17_00015620 [Ensete ventricosum]|nr:hypothetical protein GW17_00015620 [Ensete ventricosum]
MRLPAHGCDLCDRQCVAAALCGCQHVGTACAAASARLRATGRWHAATTTSAPGRHLRDLFYTRWSLDATAVNRSWQTRLYEVLSFYRREQKVYTRSCPFIDESRREIVYP